MSPPAAVQFNWLDYVLLAFLAAVAGVQFLRCIRDFSRVFYETVFVVGAVAAASALVRPLTGVTRFPAPLLFGGVGVVLVAVGLLLAAFANGFAPFGLGLFSYVFGLFFAVGCAYALGHLALRTADMAIAPHNHAFAVIVHHSLVAQDMLYFRTFIEVRAALRFARWKGM